MRARIGFYIETPDGLRVHDGRGNDWRFETQVAAHRMAKRLGLVRFHVVDEASFPTEEQGSSPYRTSDYDH